MRFLFDSTPSLIFDLGGAWKSFYSNMNFLFEPFISVFYVLILECHKVISSFTGYIIKVNINKIQLSII